VASVVVDNHIPRDLLAGARPPDLDRIAPQGVATTGLWIFRLCSSLTNPIVSGKLSAPVAALPEDLQARFRSQLTALPHHIEVLSMRELSWPMAECSIDTGRSGYVCSDGGGTCRCAPTGRGHRGVEARCRRQLASRYRS